MLNALNRLAPRIATVLALIVAPAFMAVSADDQGNKDTRDLNAKMQEKLNARLGSSIGGGELNVESKLSERVNRKSAETNERLDNQANAVTSADRSGKGDEESADSEYSENDAE